VLPRPDQLVVDAVAQFVRDGQYIVQFSRMIEEDVRGLGHEMVDAEGAAVLALFRVGVDLAVRDKPGKDVAELTVKLVYHRMDKVHGLWIGIAFCNAIYVSFVIAELPDWSNRAERIVLKRYQASRHGSDESVHDLVSHHRKMPEGVWPGRIAEFISLLVGERS
jgi:hypothetical protein